MDSVITQDLVLNIVGGLLFVAVAGLIPEPWRQRAMAIISAWASGLYWEGALGHWEYLPMFAGLVLSLAGLRWYPAVGFAWIVHTANDLAHHLLGDPLLTSFPLSSFGCAIFDPILAIWCLAGAPDLIGKVRARRRGRL